MGRRILRAILISFGITLLLALVEGAIWITSVMHAGATLPGALANVIHTPVFWLLVLLEVPVIFALVFLARRPLALYRYCKDAFNASELYRARATPLPNWPAMFETNARYYQYTPDPAVPFQARDLSILDVIRGIPFKAEPQSHLVLNGAAGSGKTTALHLAMFYALQRRNAIIYGREHIPIYVPLGQYALYRQKRLLAAQGAEQTSLPETISTLLDYLRESGESGESDLPGMHHLRGDIETFARQGRLLLLCDDLQDVDEAQQAAVILELTMSMRPDGNRVVLTSREIEYRHHPALAQAVETGQSARAVIQPLTMEHARGFIEWYIARENTGRQWRHTAGQLMDVIARTRLSTFCDTPLFLLAFLSVIDGLGIDRGRRLDTRGRLLRAAVSSSIQQTRQQKAWGGEAPSEKEVLLFLGEVTCAGRWSNVAPLIRLHEQPHMLDGVIRTIEHHAGALQRWLEAHADEMFLSDSLHHSYTQADIVRLLQFSCDASLIEISPRGLLSFRHELFAAYFIAEYFVTLQASLDSTLQRTQFAGLLSQAMKLPDSTAAFARWSIPIALWVGLVDEPAAAAERFVEYALEHPAAALEAQSLALLCLGVAAIPQRLATAQEAQQAPVALPKGLEAALAETMPREELRATLARFFSLHGEAGAQEIYQALFPLLMIPEIDAFVVALDMEIVLPLLAVRLIELVDDAAYETQVKRLVRVIGSTGEAAVPYAAQLCKAGGGRSNRLRSASINILGGTFAAGAVAPLAACLYDIDSFIVNRAATALFRLSTLLVTPTLIAELENLSQTSATQQVHAIALHILERFLNETDAARAMPLRQRKEVMTTLVSILNQPYAPEIHQRAREILVQQGQSAVEHSGGEMAIEALVHNLVIADDELAHTVIAALTDIGPAATPLLLKELQQQPSETATARIVEVLGRVHDPRSLPALLRLLADSSLLVQQQVTHALVRQGAESVPGLIYQVLHGESELVAVNAERVLGELGVAAVDPVIESLISSVPGRTHLLVNVLARIHDPQAIPALIAMLDTSLNETPLDSDLVISLINALGAFRDQRVVTPLLEILASDNPLFYEEAINALSHLELVACEKLLVALDVAEDTPITRRVERVLLGMEQFPGQFLLDVLLRGTDAQAGHIVTVLAVGGSDAAQIVVGNLLYPDRRVQAYLRESAERMSGQVIVPALLEAIDHPDNRWRAVISEFLLRHPNEAIPSLAAMLSEHERGRAAQSLLLEFGPDILPTLVTTLDALSDLAHDRARQLVVALARQSLGALREVVQLFADVQDHGDIRGVTFSPRAREALVDVLANDLADISVPVLLAGLEDVHLVGMASQTLGLMVKLGNARSQSILDELLAALRVDTRRQGAEITLVDIGSEAVAGVGSLITDHHPAVAQVAQDILCQIGVPAFAFIWAAHSDITNRERRDAARAIFRRMPTIIIKDELVQLLSSHAPEDISMALALLLERIHDEALQAEHPHEMIPVLLEHVQAHESERASRRILGLLLLLGGRSVAEHVAQVLYDYPHHQQRFLHLLLLLGDDVEETLLEILHDGSATALLRAEAAAMLGILAPHVDVREYARMLPEYGLWAGQSQGQHGVLHADQLNISLRALGGLLAGGHWHVDRLEQLRINSKIESPEHELYAILLGWRYHPHISMLEQDLERLREEHKNRMMILSQEILDLRTARAELEQELAGLHQEHGKRGKELDEVSQAMVELRTTHKNTSQERDQLRQNLQGLRQDNQALEEQLEQVTQEKQQIAARLAKLEYDLRSIGGSGGSSGQGTTKK